MTKFGIEMPVIETAMTPWSTAEFWRNAAMEPAVTPNSSATTIAHRAERQRHGEARRDELRDGVVAVLERRPEVEVQQAPNVPPELLVERLVQVIRRAQVRFDLGQQLPLAIERPAGRRADQEERQCR